MELASSQLGMIVALWDSVPWNVRRDMYVAKVRGVALHCGEVWGTDNWVKDIDAKEFRWLRKVFKWARRPAIDAVRWLLKIN